ATPPRPGPWPTLTRRIDMTTIAEPDRDPQGPVGEKPAREHVVLLRHALTNGAAVIAALLCDDPTPADARAAARAWLLAWETWRIASRIERTAANIAALTGGAR